MRALVIDHGMSRSALAGARGLAAAGWEVAIGAPARTPAAASRAVRGWHHVPAPERDLDAFVAAINSAVASRGYEVVLPSEDAQVVAVSLRRNDLDLVVPYPEHSRVLRAFDKRFLDEAARRAGFATPRAIETGPAALDTWGKPVIVKSRLHWDPVSADGQSHLGPFVEDAPAEAASRVAWIRAMGGEPVVQELLEGGLMAYQAVVDETGAVVAEVQQVAEVLWPCRGGISVRARTVPLERPLVERARELLHALGWLGLVQLQFIVPPDGEPRLIDFNGRLYGSIALAVAAGANLPALWAAVVTGRGIPPPFSGRAGVRYHWLEGDLRRAADRPLRELPGALAAAARWAPGAVHSIWRISDPLPAMRYGGILGSRAMRRVRP